jgi:hypothetical protein
VFESSIKRQKAVFRNQGRKTSTAMAQQQGKIGHRLKSFVTTDDSYRETVVGA